MPEYFEAQPMFPKNWLQPSKLEVNERVQSFGAEKSKLETVWRKSDQVNDLETIEHMFDENWMPSFDAKERKESKLESVWKRPSPSPSNSDDLPHKPNYTKMFVGMIPKSMDEGELRELFEEFGRVHSINILQDNVTGQRKGCCFVTYYTQEAAYSARHALHNVRTLKGMHHPIQMLPENPQKRSERHLFVGCINKQCNDDAIRKLFQVYGTVEECRVMRDRYGRSNGYAFVMFSTKQSAKLAITETSRNNITMEGCIKPLNVKYADTQYERRQRRLQQIEASFRSLTTGSTTSPELAKAAATAAGQDIEGPEGCNLFVLYLSQDITDADLALLFVPFGNVISAKVVIDFQTKQSKGFGFVSFDKAESAEEAMSRMNGHKVGTNRLRVQVKKPKY